MKKIFPLLLITLFAFDLYAQRPNGNYPIIGRNSKDFFDLLREAIAKEDGKRESVLKLRPVDTDDRRFYDLDQGKRVRDFRHSATLKSLYDYDPLDSNSLVINVDRQLLVEGLGLEDILSCKDCDEANELIENFYVNPDLGMLCVVENGTPFCVDLKDVNLTSTFTQTNTTGNLIGTHESGDGTVTPVYETVVALPSDDGNGNWTFTNEAGGTVIIPVKSVDYTVNGSELTNGDSLFCIERDGVIDVNSCWTVPQSGSDLNGIYSAANEDTNKQVTDINMNNSNLKWDGLGELTIHNDGRLVQNFNLESFALTNVLNDDLPQRSIMIGQNSGLNATRNGTNLNLVDGVFIGYNADPFRTRRTSYLGYQSGYQSDSIQFSVVGGGSLNGRFMYDVNNSMVWGGVQNGDSGKEILSSVLGGGSQNGFQSENISTSNIFGGSLNGGQIKNVTGSDVSGGTQNGQLAEDIFNSLVSGGSQNGREAKRISTSALYGGSLNGEMAEDVSNSVLGGGTQNGRMSKNITNTVLWGAVNNGGKIEDVNNSLVLGASAAGLEAKEIETSVLHGGISVGRESFKIENTYLAGANYSGYQADSLTNSVVIGGVRAGYQSKGDNNTVLGGVDTYKGRWGNENTVVGSQAMNTFFPTLGNGFVVNVATDHQGGQVWSSPAIAAVIAQYGLVECQNFPVRIEAWDNSLGVGFQQRSYLGFVVTGTDEITRIEDPVTNWMGTATTITLSPPNYRHNTGAFGFNAEPRRSNHYAYGDDRVELHQFTAGDVQVEELGSGLVLRSPDGNCWRTTVDNAGNLSTVLIPCEN